MPPLSFRSILLASFLLIAVSLAVAVAGGWRGMETVVHAIRADKQRALALSAAARQLRERSVDLERSARQYQVLGEPALAQRFEATLAAALPALALLESAGPALAGEGTAWRANAGRVAAWLASLAASRPAPGTPDGASAQPLPATAAKRGDGLATEDDLRNLGVRADRLAAALDQHLGERDLALMDTLERARHTVALQTLPALVLAGVLAALVGWWLLRPLGRIEQAIDELGESRLARPIDIDGPADLRRLGARLDWLRLRLAELEADRRRVLRHVSHELKTPLASLREGVALLEDGVLGPLTPAQREVTGILAHSAHTLQARIEQLLQLNASQFDARSVRLQPTALLPLLREVGEEQRLPARARGVTIGIAGDALIVHADAGKLHSVFSNLLANAIAFSPAGGHIRIELGLAGENVVVDCRDEGPGIAPDELERVFEPFFQGRRSPPAGAGGSGIGLAIVREFISAHRGRVRALPSGRGAHFRVELPHA
ncbi:MAG: HAMP domain-containing protein [Thauera sp.]|nr:HAMP domain-containing protein [Thauera sp.]